MSINAASILTLFNCTRLQIDSIDISSQVINDLLWLFNKIHTTESDTCDTFHLETLRNGFKEEIELLNLYYPCLCQLLPKTALKKRITILKT